MRFLVDTSPNKMAALSQRELVAGQLLTPLTNYANAGGVFAIDNGAFSGFRGKDFARLLVREERNRERCLFVTVPDIVANARRTLEIWKRRESFAAGWPLALVAQDGMEELEIPWDEMSAVFIGGGDPWKDSKAALDIVRTAKTLGVRVHVGRVNQIARYRRFAAVGADTCDGSSIAMFDQKLLDIETALAETPAPTLWDEAEVAFV